MQIFNVSEIGIDIDELNKNCENKYNEKNLKGVSAWNYNELNQYFIDIIYRLRKKFDLEKNFSVRKIRVEKYSNKLFQKNQLPFVPHIDFDRCLKIMIYLENVDDEEGAFCIAPKDPNYYEKKRLSLSPNKKNKINNSIIDFNLQDYLVFKGKKGSAIFFDTNEPHYASEIKSDKTRFILRIDFKNSNWKMPIRVYLKKFYFDKFLNYFKKFI